MHLSLLLYISAATDLAPERDVLGRAVAEIPVDLNWRIVHSPHGNEPLDRAAVTQADAHLLLLGGDIRAPIGLEYLAARQAGRLPYPLLKRDAGRTAAAEDFVRFVGRVAAWQPYEDAAALRRLALEHLAALILRQAERLRLTPTEMERLRQWQAALADDFAQPGTDVTRGGAGESGLLFSQERFRPSGGVPLGKSDDGS